VKPLEALLCVAASLIGLMTLGPILVQHLGLVGIVLSELILLLLPTIGFLQARGLPVAFSLGLSTINLSALVGGALAGAGAFWLVALLEVLLERILPVPPQLEESLRHLVNGPSSVIWGVLALAVTPALCEEGLFRGLVQPSLTQRVGARAAIVATALLFAAFHLSIYRFLPTALLGLLLGFLRQRTGSLWPAVAFHTVNNALVLTLVRMGRDNPPQPTNVVGLAGLGGAVIALTGGIALVARSPQRA
jgi:sodium transport system permease protein